MYRTNRLSASNAIEKQQIIEESTPEMTVMDCGIFPSAPKTFNVPSNPRVIMK
jgi:hypothetical protein